MFNHTYKWRTKYNEPLICLLYKLPHHTQHNFCLALLKYFKANSKHHFISSLNITVGISIKE